MIRRLSWLPQNNQILFIILSLSVLLRLTAALFLGDAVEVLPGTYDQVSYHALALRVLDGHGFTFGQQWWPITSADAPTAHWSYLYTFYLVIVYALFGPHPLAARLIQILVVGLLQPLLVYLIARRAFGQPVGLAAAALTTIYVYFIYYTATLMTEPFYITAILAVLYLSILLVDHSADPDLRRSRNIIFALAIGLGLTLGIVVLLRQLFLLIIPFLFLWIWWASRSRGGRWTLPALLVSGFCIITVILPFTIDNYARFGRFVLLNTNAGYAFFWANHPIYGVRFEPILPPDMSTYQSLIPLQLRGLDEAALDQALLKRGLQFVLDDPIRYLRLSLSRIPVYFMFWPSPDSSPISNLSRISSFALLLPFMLYGLFLTIVNHDRREPVLSETKDLPTEVSNPTFQSFNLPSPDPVSPGPQDRRGLPTEASNPSFQSFNLPSPNPLSPNPSDHLDLVTKPSPPTFRPSNLPSSNPSNFKISAPTTLLILFALLYSTIHLLSWALIRYRLPVDAVLLVFAALALVDLAERLGVAGWITRYARLPHPTSETWRSLSNRKIS